MENAKKNLKVASWLVLALAAFTVVRKVVDAVINGFEVKEVPADMTEDLVRISLIVAFSFGFVVILPQLYIAIKGFKIANAPCHAKGVCHVPGPRPLETPENISKAIRHGCSG